MVRVAEIRKNINTDFSEILNHYVAFLETSKTRVNEATVRSNVEEIIEIIKNNDVKRIPYDSVTTVVIEFNLKSEEIDGLSESIAILLDYAKSSLGDISNDLIVKNSFNGNEIDKHEIESLEDSVIAFYKLLEHTNLAYVQYQSLYKKTENEVQKLNETTQESVYRYRELNKTARELKRNYKNLNVEIISVLGIFASIIFAVFGGVSQLGQLGENLKNTSLGKIFIFIGSSSFLLFSVLFIAFNTTARLTDRNMKACCNRNRCGHWIFQRYPIYFWSMAVSIIMVIVGAIIEFTAT